MDGASGDVKLYQTVAPSARPPRAPTDPVPGNAISLNNAPSRLNIDSRLCTSTRYCATSRPPMMPALSIASLRSGTIVFHWGAAPFSGVASAARLGAFLSDRTYNVEP